MKLETAKLLVKIGEKLDLDVTLYENYNDGWKKEQGITIDRRVNLGQILFELGTILSEESILQGEIKEEISKFKVDTLGNGFIVY